MKSSKWFLLGLLCMAGLCSAEFVTEPFDDFPTGGTGWSSDWLINPVSPALNSISIGSGSAINNGGNYLVYRTLVTGRNGVYRDFSESLARENHTIKFDIRVDTLGDFFGVTSLNDRIQIHGDTGNGADDMSSSSSWVIMATPNTALDNWYVYNGAQTGAYSASHLLNTGIPVVEGGVYSFTIDVHPSTLTYDAEIKYGTSVFSQKGLKFRAGPAPVNPPNRIVLANKIKPVGGTELQLSYDSIRIFPAGANTPNPVNNGIQIPLENPVLSWTPGMSINPSNPNGNPITNPGITGHYVYFRENDPNLAITPTFVTAPSYTLPANLQLNSVYYWRVDESLNGVGPDDPNNIKGTVWTFAAKTTDPVVWAGQNVVTYLENGSATVNIEADIDWYNPQGSIEWTVTQPAGAPEGSLVFSSTSVEDPTVTITFAGKPYELKLKATDVNGAFAESTMHIDVYENSCTAARNVLNYQAIPGDLNNDCRINSGDLVLMAANWLKQNYLLENGTY